MEAVPRIACADVVALPLQLVLRAHPTWRADPVVVVEADLPQARILWANRPARRHQIVPGMRFCQAEAVARRLRAAVVTQAEADVAVRELLGVLLRFSPDVEPARGCPGLFWLAAGGLERLFAGLDAWARRVHEALSAAGFVASVVVGFARHGTFALARARTGWVVLQGAAEERSQAEAIPLAALELTPDLCAQMHKLGITTLGEFLRLPARELGLRYGPEARHLHALASGAVVEPLAPVRLLEPLRVEVPFELAESDLARVLWALEEALRQPLPELQRRGEAIAALILVLRLEHAAPREERIEAAAPTLDLAQLLELVRLRLEARQLAAPVESLAVELVGAAVPKGQLALPTATSPCRDLAAGARALARLRAAFGQGTATYARLLPRHLPEAAFTWEKAASLAPPRGNPVVGPPPLVRAFYASPLPLDDIPTHEPERWLGVHGVARRMHGPFRINGGWWKRRVERDYYFIETDRGSILWAFYDRRRRHWFLHGRVD